MTRPSRVVAVIATLGSLLTLTACGTPVPSVVGSYTATLVYTPHTEEAKAYAVGNRNSVFALVIGEDGHFAMQSRGHNRVTFEGTWNESRSQIILSEHKGTTKIDFVAVQKGQNLR